MLEIINSLITLITSLFSVFGFVLDALILVPTLLIELYADLPGFIQFGFGSLISLVVLVISLKIVSLVKIL